MIKLNQKLFISLISFVVILFILGLLFSKQNVDPNQRALKSRDCQYCHGDMDASEVLSQRASGKHQIIYYHSTHVKGKKMACTDCHDIDNYHEARPKMADCLICHDNRLASNDCSLCHMNHEQLNFEN
jgi:hypothetical protein